MTDLEFDSLTIKDFCEYTTEAYLNLAKLGKGLTFVRAFNHQEPALGSNGGGKSTIFNAITWCLFGKTNDGRRGTDIRPWAKPKAHAEVKLVLYVNNRKEVLERSTVSNGLWINGKVVTQETVEDMIGMSYAVWVNAVMFGQGQPLFLDLKPGEKLKLLSDALGLDRWDTRIKDASTRATEYDRAFHAATGELTTLDRLLTEINRDMDDAKLHQREWDDLEAKNAKRIGEGIEKDRQALEQFRDQLGRADLDYDAAETELRHAEKMLDEANTKAARTEGDYAAATATLNAEDDKLKALQADLRDMVDECPTCGTKLNAKNIAKHRTDVKAKIRAQEDRADAAFRHSKTALNDVHKAREVCASWAADVRAFRAKSNEAIDKRTQAQTRVADLRAVIEAQEKAAKTKAVNPYDQQVQALRARKEETTSLIVTADRLVKLTTERHASNKYWVNGFKQVRLYLLEEFLNELEVITQDMLPRLGLIGWEVQLRIERETQRGDTTSGLSVMITKPGADKGVKWESWSGGEAQRLRVAGALALSETLLRRAGVYCDLVVLDEPTQHLSPEGVADLVESLLEIARDRQVILIDHVARETNRFAHVITVDRDGSGSRLSVD